MASCACAPTGGGAPAQLARRQAARDTARGSRCHVSVAHLLLLLLLELGDVVVLVGDLQVADEHHSLAPLLLVPT